MPESPSPTPKVLCAGILVADHVSDPMPALPEAGQLVAVDALYLLTGGCAANVAVNVAKQGIPASAIGCLGEDFFGTFVRQDLESHGVDCSYVTTSAEQQTSQTLILLCEGEDRRFVHTFGANRDLTPGSIHPEDWSQAEVFYLGGYLVLPGMDPEATARLFQRCHELGVRTMLDVVIPADFTYAGELDAILPHLDVFMPNNDEAELLTEERDPVVQARNLRERGVGTVIVTLGAEGLIATDGRQMLRAGRYPAVEVDATGAGDAFAAGFIAGMVQGLDLERCLAYGSALGSSCVTAIGCHQGVLDAESAASFIQENPLPVTPLQQ